MQPHVQPHMQPLSAKIEAGLALLEPLAVEYGPEHCAVAFTGGKDSTVALWLWRQALQRRGFLRDPAARHDPAAPNPLRALNLDTGLKFPEVLETRDRLAALWNLDLTVARPEVDPAAYPVAKDKTACCAELKVAPLKRALAEQGIRVLITGIRGDEHASRFGREPLERLDDPPHVRAHPLLAWTEMDVWGLIHDQGLPYCPLYDRGYRSLGCMPCTAKSSGNAERSGRDADKEARLAELRSLGYF